MTDTNHKPAITIILPVYNGGKYLVSSVESVLQQHFKDFEFLILDDCSTDNSLNYLDGINDPGISVFRNEKNMGLFYNINFLIKKSKSPLLKLWAQDDVMYPHCLETFVAFHKKNPDLGFSYSDRDIIDENGNIKPTGITDNTPEIISTDLHARIAFFTGSIAGNIANVCINKKALEKVGLFKEEMKISADFDMWVRLAKDHNTGFISDKLIQLRDHAGQLSRQQSYYINHVTEDMEVYRNLINYVKPPIRKEGRQLLRNYKFVYYYTLMIKALAKGKVQSGFSFYKELKSMDSFLKISIAFLRAKIFGMKKPGFILSLLKEEKL